MKLNVKQKGVNMKRLVLLSFLSVTTLGGAMAQDDLYFTPTKKNVERSAAQYGMPRDTYYSGSQRGVDDYNRRGGSHVQPIDSLGNDIINFDGVRGTYPDSLSDDYQYTRRMSRFDDYAWSDTYWSGYDAGRRDAWGLYDPWFYDPWYTGYGYYGWYYSPWRHYGWYDPWYGGHWWNGGWVGGVTYRPVRGGVVGTRNHGYVDRGRRNDFRGRQPGVSSNRTGSNFSNPRPFNRNDFSSPSVSAPSRNFSGSSFGGNRGGGFSGGNNGGGARSGGFVGRR